MIKMTNSERMELLGMLADVVEDWLDEKEIVVENDEKEQDPEAANIYGKDYDILINGFADVLQAWRLIPTEKEVFELEKISCRH